MKRNLTQLLKQNENVDDEIYIKYRLEIFLLPLHLFFNSVFYSN